MKIFLFFITIYFVVIGSLFNFYINISKSQEVRIEANNSEINGIEYLKAITQLSLKVATYEGEKKLDEKFETLKQEITKTIDNIYYIQEKYPNFKNDIFNKKLENLKKFDMSSEEYYEFLDYINHENYRIGDISSLLFEPKRKIYFRTSLITHYLPEYLISTSIAHNLIKEYIYTGTLNDKRKNLFLEQTKLIYLSSAEIFEIIELLSIYKDSKDEVITISELINDLSTLEKEIDLQNIFDKDISVLNKYIKITNEITLNSYKLDRLILKKALDNLKERKTLLHEKSIFTKSISLFILLIISVLFFFSYRMLVLKIRENKALEKEKERTQEALEFRSKFLSNMSHEIRTPLNGIIGLTHIALKDDLSIKQKDIMNKIASSSDLLLGVVNDILDISKIESGKMTLEKIDFNLKKIIDNIIGMFTDKAKSKAISLDVKYINIDNYNYIGDPLRISQVVINLMSNAIKFTEEGTIEISLENVGNNKLLFKVTDTGIGLKPDQIETLFEEFVQADMNTSRKFGGTGLGLAISKNLVQMMGSFIGVESEYTKGSSFFFTLNLENSLEILDEEQDELNHSKDLEEKINQLENISILVAEDNKMNQIFLSMLLEDTQFNIEFANDGLLALSMFENNKYNLILMDIQMPNLDGYETTKEIRKIDSNIPIIALSANIMSEDIDKAYECGMNGYISKPIEVDKLYKELLMYLG